MGLPVIKEQNSQYDAKLTLQLSACILLSSSEGGFRWNGEKRGQVLLAVVLQKDSEKVH